MYYLNFYVMSVIKIVKKYNDRGHNIMNKVK